MLNENDSRLLVEACENYTINQFPSARFALVALLRALEEVYGFGYDEDALRNQVNHWKTMLTGGAS